MLPCARGFFASLAHASAARAALSVGQARRAFQTFAPRAVALASPQSSVLQVRWFAALGNASKASSTKKPAAPSTEASTTQDLDGVNVADGLKQFFSEGNVYEDLEVGRPWLARDLRIKSYEDLQKASCRSFCSLACACVCVCVV
jgi:hypothetical protein